MNPAVAKKMPDRTARQRPAHGMLRILSTVLVIRSGGGSGAAGKVDVAIVHMICSGIPIDLLLGGKITESLLLVTD